jgi:ubiquinone/menaquinone biosynthesis C-methylase UbiE
MSERKIYSGRFQNSTKAQKYATRFERGGRRQIDEREQKAVQKIFSKLKDCRSVLDVPSGAGRFLQNLARDNREVIEVDVAAEILEFAKERAAKLGVKAQFKQGDASHLPFENESVDAIFCNRLLHHFPNATQRLAFLREFHRVSRKYLVVSFFDYLAFGGARKLLKRLKGRKVTYEGQPTLDEFKGEVAQCGFRLLEIVPTGAPWIAQKYFVLEKA